jgi:hypothetical protein
MTGNEAEAALGTDLRSAEQGWKCLADQSELGGGLAGVAPEGNSTSSAAAMSDAPIIPTRALADREAMGWLRAQGRVEVTVSGLARAWRWERRTVQRRLARWAAEGHLVREVQPGGASVITMRAPAQPVAHPPAHPPAQPDSTGDRLPVTTEATHLPARILRTGAEDAHRVEVEVVPPPARSPVTARPTSFLAAVLLLTGLSLGAIGLALNAMFAASLGRTPGASVLLAGIGVALDVLAMVLPATGATLWHRRRRMLALVAWSLWPTVLCMVLLSATGFAAGNLGDAVAGRARAAETVADLRHDLERLRAERAGIGEVKSPGEIAAAIERTRVAPWALPCTSPDSAEARRACDPVMKLRQAQALAQRRDQLDVEVRQAEAKLEGLSAVGLADPTAFAAEIVTWVSAGRITPTAADIYRTRIVGLVIAPSAAGLVLMLAAGLIGGRRQ